MFKRMICLLAAVCLIAVCFVGCKKKTVAASDVANEFRNLFAGKELVRVSGSVDYKTPQTMDSVSFVAVFTDADKAAVSLTADLGGGRRTYENFLILNNKKIYADCKQFLPVPEDMFYGAEDLITDNIYDSFIELVDLNVYAQDGAVQTLKTVFRPIYDDILQNRTQVGGEHSCCFTYTEGKNAELASSVSSAAERNLTDIVGGISALCLKINGSEQACGINAVRLALKQDETDLLESEEWTAFFESAVVNDFSVKLINDPSAKKSDIDISLSFNIKGTDYAFDVSLMVDAPAEIDGKTKADYDGVIAGKDRRVIKLADVCSEIVTLLEGYAKRDDKEKYTDVYFTADSASRTLDYGYYKVRETFIFNKTALSRYEFVIFDITNIEAADLFRYAASADRYTAMKSTDNEYGYYTTNTALFPIDVTELAPRSPRELAESFGQATAVASDGRTVTRNDAGITVDVVANGKRTTALYSVGDDGSIKRVTFTVYNADTLDRDGLAAEGFIFAPASSGSVQYYTDDPALILDTLHRFAAPVADLSAENAYSALGGR